VNKKFCVGNLKGGADSEDLGVDRTIILDWILEKYCGKLWIGCISLRIGASGGIL
jgi:hypothetical protein